MSGAPPAAPKPGDILAGKYKVERMLGMGGMGCVVAARHLDLGELRAIKLMLPEVAFDGASVERFLREARAAVRLKSVHVVTVHDVGRLENGAPYIVMELMEGSDAEHLVESSGPVPIPGAVDIVLQALEGLAEAHAAGIVHRDLKPANMFLTRDEDGARLVKLLDFGISKLSSTDPKMQMTQSTCLMGSPYYMSPEQMRSTRDVDHRTDIWSMGVILYELLTATLPFKAETLPAQGALVLTGAPQPPSLRRPGIPERLDAVVLRCMEKDPASRYPNVLELATALAPFNEAAAARSLPRIERMSGGRRSAAPEIEPAQARGGTGGTVDGLSLERRTMTSGARTVVALLIALLALGTIALFAVRFLRPPAPQAAASQVAAEPAAPASASAPPVLPTAPTASASASASAAAAVEPTPIPKRNAARPDAGAPRPKESAAAPPAPTTTTDPFGWKNQ